MECKEWYDRTIRQIQAGQWDKLQPHHARWSCDDACVVCDSAYYVEMVFIDAGIFSPDALDAAHMLCGYTEPSWFATVTTCAPPVATLSAMLEAGLFQVNQVGTSTLIEVYVDIRPPWWREAIDYLLSQGASIDLQNTFRRTPLLTTIMYLENKEEAVRFLVSRGADTNLEDQYGHSPETFSDEIRHMLDL